MANLDFEKIVRGYCTKIGWRAEELDANHAKLGFTMESGRLQVLYLISYGEHMEFSVPSIAVFDSEEEIPGDLSSVLLHKSAANKIGFWCIEKIGDKLAYSIMHNVELRHLDKDLFETIAMILVHQCDEFDGGLLELAGKSQSSLQGGDAFGKGFLQGAGSVLGKVAMVALLGVFGISASE